MKKITFTLLLTSLLTLSACNSKKDKTVTSSSSSSTTTSSSLLKPSESTSTSEAQILSSSAQSTELPEEAQNNSDNSVITEEQAQQHILETFPDTNKEDVSLVFWQMIDKDFLFKAYSKSMSSQGGSGTLGFFRVTSDGNVYETDGSGTPF